LRSVSIIFPRPGLFFTSAIPWTTLTVAVWYLTGDSLGVALGFQLPASDAPPVISIGY
jgi:peptide/bleomycin uptake transporter